MNQNWRYETSFFNIRFYKLLLKIRVIDWQSYPSLCDTLFSVNSMIRHYGFYRKRMIRHYVIHPTNLYVVIFRDPAFQWSRLLWTYYHDSYYFSYFKVKVWEQDFQECQEICCKIWLYCFRKSGRCRKRSWRHNHCHLLKDTGTQSSMG